MTNKITSRPALTPLISTSVGTYFFFTFGAGTSGSIASFLFFYSIEIFASGKYNGFFYNGTGLPAYIIAFGYLVSSTLYIINIFFPIIKRLRPKFGITLLAFAAILELIFSKVF